MSNPSFALKRLMSHASVVRARKRRNAREWTYAFHAKSRLVKFPLALFVNTQWKGYMDVCLENVVKQFLLLLTSHPVDARFAARSPLY